MNYLISAVTNIGLTKNTNQDSHAVRVYNTPCGRVAFAILCDGMGGLEKGEVASATLVTAFCKWADERLPALCAEGFPENVIRDEWCSLTYEYNEKIKSYAKENDLTMGTTLTAILLTGERYYIINVGDTRAYEITATEVNVLTKDQTVVAREVELGLLTPEAARVDPRRSVLLQCVGASESVVPDIFVDDVKADTVYMLCSDGFRHEISEEEIHAYLNPYVMCDPSGMQQNATALVDLNMQRQERDNITVVAVRTYEES